MVPIAKAALLEAGRPDLASIIITTPLGKSAMANTTRSRLDKVDAAVLIRALYIAHVAFHPACHREDREGRGEPTHINCPTCKDEAAS